MKIKTFILQFKSFSKTVHVATTQQECNSGVKLTNCQRRLDSGSQSIMDNERLIARALSLMR